MMNPGVAAFNVTATPYQPPRKNNPLALGVTAVLLLAAYIGLRVAALPQSNFMAQHYDDIDWMRFVPESRPVIEEAIEQPQSKQPSEMLESPSVMPRRIDLAAELKELSFDLTAPAETNLPSRRTESSRSVAPQREQLALSNDDFSLNLSLDPSNLDSRLPSRGRAPAGGDETGIDLSQSSGHAQSGGLKTESSGSGLSGPVGRAESGAVEVQVGLKNLNSFSGDYQNFSPIYRALIEWMQRNRTDMPEVVDRFMGFQPGNLTASVTFTVNGRRFQMFLLCVEASYEVRVCLLEGDVVTYLIDQGFKKQSNYLRVGTSARLPGSNTIHRFGSELREASSTRTQEFYQVFLSWWETVRHEVER